MGLHSRPEAVTHKVRETIARFQMLQPNETVVVGVSGGPDSLTLLHVLWRLRTEFGWQILAVHFNHGLRGEEADADEAFVKSFCERWGIPCVTQKADVKACSPMETFRCASGAASPLPLFRRSGGKSGRNESGVRTHRQRCSGNFAAEPFPRHGVGRLARHPSHQSLDSLG